MLKLLVELHLIKDLNEITAVGHRVVAGGEYFDHSVVIDDDVIQKIAELSDLARLHNPANLLGIKVFKKLLPNALAVASFDTAYHHSIPEKIISTVYPLNGTKNMAFAAMELTGSVTAMSRAKLLR